MSDQSLIDKLKSTMGPDDSDPWNVGYNYAKKEDIAIIQHQAEQPQNMLEQASNAIIEADKKFAEPCMMLKKEHADAYAKAAINSIGERTTTTKNGDNNAPPNGESMACEESGAAAVRSGEIPVVDETAMKSEIGRIMSRSKQLGMTGYTDQASASIVEFIRPYLRLTEPVITRTCTAPHETEAETLAYMKSFATPEPVAAGEISVVDDYREKISNALECANLFVLKHCDKPKAVEVIQAINVGRDALRLPEPVSVDLELGAQAISKTLDRPDNWGSTPFVELSKACAEAWGLSWK